LCDDEQSAFCAAPVCGDGKQNQLIEECDDANDVTTDNCVACVSAVCGDGYIQAGVEECDDGGVPTAACVGCQLIPESARVVQVSSGGGHNCVLDTLGRVKCWGENGVAGKLGLGDTNHRGDNPNEMTALPHLDFGPGRTVKTLAVGLHHNCAILDDDSLKCWGAGGDGALGIGPSDNKGDAPNEMGAALPTVNLGAGRTAKAVAVGDFHTCAIADDDSLKCWGNNANGQLGQGNTTRLYAPPASPVYLGAGRSARAVSAGTYHTCAVLDDFSVKCWGENGNGQLGIGDTGDRGLTWNQMLGLPTVSLGAGRMAKAVSAGSYHSCALLDDDTIKCWGNNSSGQLGQGDTVQRGDAAGEMGDNLLTVALGSGRTAREVVTYDAYGTCALLDDLSVKCWGDNLWGQLGQGNTASRGDQANELGDNLLAINLGTNRTAQAIATGRYHVCALLDDDSVKCWGINSFGELGIGSTASRGNSAGQMGDSLLPLPLP
jgi:alpha-tubulin suppressor-like RCC1 family protein